MVLGTWNHSPSLGVTDTVGVARISGLSTPPGRAHAGCLLMVTVVVAQSVVLDPMVARARTVTVWVLVRYGARKVRVSPSPVMPTEGPETTSHSQDAAGDPDGVPVNTTVAPPLTVDGDGIVTDPGASRSAR